MTLKLNADTYESFRKIFGQNPHAHANAPGRVNLMGDHTDYNGGLVLPAVLNLHTYTDLGLRHDNQVRIWSREYSKDQLECFTLGEESPRGTWIDYIKGVTYVLKAAGYTISGFDLMLSSEVPIGSGLSSSAALEVSLLRGLRELFELQLDDLELARLGQKVETDFVGAPVGIMDQMASSLGQDHCALFINTQMLSYKTVPIPESIDLLIIDSGIAHQHATGGYRQRRHECDQAAKILGVHLLSDLAYKPYNLNKLPSPLKRRVEHVLSENARVTQTVEAFTNNDLEALRRIFAASHRSLSQDFEVSTPEIDALVQLAMEDPSVIGARMTGGGFGGSIVALTHHGQSKEAGNRILEKAQSKNLTPKIV